MHTLKKHWIKFTIAVYLLCILGYTLAFSILNWGNLTPLTSNELGDFLSGSFAPLAFFILIMGYIQQGKELQQNTEPLRLQADELKATNETLKVQTQEIQKNVEHQGQLVLINQQEIDSKHFSVLPYFERPISTFEITDEQEHIYDADGNFEEVEMVKIGSLQFTFKNIGEVAKNFEMNDEQTNLVAGSAIEILKGSSKVVTITLDPEEIDRLNENSSYKNTFSIKYFDQYGKEFNQRIVCTLIHDHEKDRYRPSLKIFN